MNSKKLGCGGSLYEVPAKSLPAPAGFNDLRVLYVATDLSMWAPQRPEQVSRDCQIGSTCYRKLDPEYFAWLKARMHAVKAAVETGRVPRAAFEELRQRFNEVQTRAIEAFGERALLDAVRMLDPATYRPPLPEEFEKRKPVKSVVPRTNPESERLVRARGLVDQIRGQALALGWTMESLYFSDGYERYPISPRYGLVCYIRTEYRIGAVTRQSIELIGPPPMETRTRFYNPDVDQPWISRR